MSTSFTPGNPVRVISGPRRGRTGEVVDLGMRIRVHLDGTHADDWAAFDPIELELWTPLSRTLGAQAPTTADAEQDWDDRSIYDIVAATAPYAPRRCEDGATLPRRPRGCSSQTAATAVSS